MVVEFGAMVVGTTEVVVGGEVSTVGTVGMDISVASMGGSVTGIEVGGGNSRTGIAPALPRPTSKKTAEA